jgi:hypothetical protein
VHKINRLNWILATACVVYSALMLALGWAAIASSGFARQYVISAVVATVGFGIALTGYKRQNPWIMGAGVAAVMLFCPTPLGVIPMFVGFVLIIVFGFVYARKVENTGTKGWARHEP